MLQTFYNFIKTNYYKKKIYKYLLIYTLSILLFGTFYKVYWFFKPDSFIIDNQFNLHPFSSEEISNHQENDLIYYQNKADSLRKAYNLNKENLKKYIAKQDSLKPLKNVAIEAHEKIRWKNIKEWEEQQIPDSLTSKLKNLKSTIKYLSSKNNSSLILSDFKVTEAKLEYKIAIIKSNSANYVLKNLKKFEDKKLIKDVIKLDSLFHLYELTLIPNTENDLYKTQYEISMLRFDAINRISKRISWLDFLLFSASNSSTVTYGEIIPNDNYVRAVLFFQALFCIFLIAFASENLISNRKQN